MNDDLKIIKQLEKEIGQTIEVFNRWGDVKIDPKTKACTYIKGKGVVALYLNGTAFSVFPTKILELKNLKVLCLIAGKLESIPPEINTLKSLDTLTLVHLGLSSLPKEITDLDITELRVKDFLLKSPPNEIAEQGMEAVRNYFDQLEQAEGQIKYLFEAKMLIIGDGETGKTSFRKKIKNAEAAMPKEKDTTLGIDVDTWNYQIQLPDHTDTTFHVNLWDFGGQNIYRGTHQIFFSDKSYYVLVADSRKEGTDFSYWLNTVEQLAGDDSAVLILLNKKFGRGIRFDERGFRGHFGNIIKEVFEIDLQNDPAKMQVLQDMVKLHLRQLPGIGDQLPASWVQIRKELLKEKKNFISFDRFHEICEASEITDPSVIRTLSGYFSRIGAFTHYIDDDLLRERIYLNSNWLANTVYKVLDNKLAKDKKGRLKEVDVKAIWRKDELNFEINRLTQLMDKFGLMYQVPKSNDYVVPEHLPADQPYDTWEHDSTTDLLRFTYEFDKYMPKGLMSRLIVSLHNHIQDHDRVWHQGFNIELEGAYAEIIETYGSRNTFRIRVAGTNKIELLAVVREHFSQILESYKNLNYKQCVPCVCNECLAAATPSFHDYDTLLNFRDKGKPSQCSSSGESVDVSDLLRITESVKDRDDLAEEKPIDSSTLKTVEIFLASSSELEKDRKEVEIWINRENKKLIKKGIFLQLNLWEDFLDAMSKTRLQDEYNKAVAQSDIVLCLFATKVGKYTREEFEIAYAHFKKLGKPAYIYTYFKDVNISSSSDMNSVKEFLNMKQFQEKLNELGHFYTSYKSTEDLNRQLKTQLDTIIDGIC